VKILTTRNPTVTENETMELETCFFFRSFSFYNFASFQYDHA